VLTTEQGKKALRGKAIYIGAGETDPNLESAKKAAAYYEHLGAKVTFEMFKGEGHSFDPSGSEILQKWLLCRNGCFGTAEMPGVRANRWMKGDISRGEE
jgi:predicted esterase